MKKSEDKIPAKVDLEDERSGAFPGASRDAEHSLHLT